MKCKNCDNETMSSPYPETIFRIKIPFVEMRILIVKEKIDYMPYCCDCQADLDNANRRDEVDKTINEIFGKEDIDG